MKKVIILGSTGSIGRQTLDLVRKFPRKFKVVGLAAGSNSQLLKKQISEFKPKFIATQTPEKFSKEKILPVEKLAVGKCDLVVSAISGVAGLPPTLAALQAKNNVALANKESLVLAGKLVMSTAKKSGAKITPIDSEHSGVQELLKKVPKEKIRKIILTASGGALRDVPISQFAKITPKKVLAHPTWQMGPKITLDCATMANKAFEVIEAAHLFDIPLEKISAVIHPQSLIHAMVETIDGNIFAQISQPSMMLPISLALFDDERQSDSVAPLSIIGKNFEFREISKKRYPLFFTILEAAEKGGLAPAIAAASSETAGQKFLNREIPFTEIEKLTSKALKNVTRKPANLKNILEVMENFA